MKNFKLACLALFAMSVLAACGSKNSNSNNGGPIVGQPTGAAYAMPPECRVADPYISNSGWNRHRRFGFERSQWGYDDGRRYEQYDRYDRDQRNSRRRHRRQVPMCPRGSFPACSPGFGIVCVPQQPYLDIRIAVYGYQMGQTQATWTGYNQCHQVGFGMGGNAGTLGMVCQVANPISCNGIGACRPVSQNAPIGICVQ
jgi:hypothetical protein